MRQAVDFIVCACLLFALYLNLTDFPKPTQSREVSGSLIKIGVE